MTAASISLRGMTWDHARGYEPLAATAAEYQKLHPEVRIVWERRSLRDFEEFPIRTLAAEYDLIVFDHPFVGDIARNRPLLPLDEHLPDAFWRDQADNAVGASHRSYQYGGHQWALAIDAAAPVAFWRPDLMAGLGLAPPVTWQDLLALAREGHVEIPAAPINCLMNFYTMCLACGEAPFGSERRVVAPDVGASALDLLRELVAACDRECLSRNPIASHERVASDRNARVAYCPLAYGYSNYSRDGFAGHPLIFGAPPLLRDAPLRTVLGGTGLGVSALRPQREAAVAYAAYVASGEIQRTTYARNGGQPGHRRAWLDEENNRLTRDCFRHTLDVLDRAYLRPRYDGYVAFQEHAGPVVHAAVAGTVSAADALARLDSIHGEAQRGTHSPS